MYTQFFFYLKEKCDIWSLGCIIFEMLTNNYLFCPEKGDRMSED